MIFNFLIRQTQQETTTTTFHINIGQLICGLQKSGQRPQSVTLTSTELMYLLKDNRYAMMVVAALARTSNDL
jgi:hypothetical protein